MIHRKGYLFLLANISFSILAYFVLDFTYELFPSISVFQGMFWGFLGSFFFALPLLIAAPFRKSVIQEYKSQGKFLWSIVILSTIANLFWLYGIQQSNAGIVALLENTQALFAFLLGLSFLKELTSKKLFLYMGFVFLGIILISSLKENISISLATIILFSSLIFAFQSFCLKKWGNSINGIPFVFLRLVGMLCVLSVFFIIVPGNKTIPINAFFLLSFAHILGVIVCRYFFFEAHKYLSISVINLSLLILPVAIVTLEYIFFGVSLSSQKLIGSMCIMIGMYFFIQEKQKLHFKK
jgi:drug/metabolite transporter (DMT)-like permease